MLSVMLNISYYLLSLKKLLNVYSFMLRLLIEYYPLYTNNSLSNLKSITLLSDWLVALSWALKINFAEMKGCCIVDLFCLKPEKSEVQSKIFGCKISCLGSLSLNISSNTSEMTRSLWILSLGKYKNVLLRPLDDVNVAPTCISHIWYYESNQVWTIKSMIL